MSFDVLQDKIRAMKNPTVAGLDARIDYVPEHIRQAAFAEHGTGLEGACEAIYQFNVGLIDALCDIVPAVKPQSAYYENLGWRGMEMLERTIRYAKSKGLFVIADIKRGDIGSTASAYAEGWLSGVKIGEETFKTFDADCVTLNGYMGSDSINPFLKAAQGEDKCVFVLVKTSNLGSQRFVRGPGLGFSPGPEGDRTALEREVLADARKSFPPEFLNRLDAALVFHPLDHTSLVSITRQLLDQAGARLAELGVSLSAEEGAVELLARSGGDREYGARPLRRAVSSLVEDPAADLVLRGALVPGDTLQVSVSQGKVTVRPVSPK